MTGKKGIYTGSKSTSSLPRRIKLHPEDGRSSVQLMIDEKQQEFIVQKAQEVKVKEAPEIKVQEDAADDGGKKISVVSFISGDLGDRRRSLIHGFSRDSLDQEDDAEEVTEKPAKKYSTGSQSTTSSEEECSRREFARTQFRSEHKVMAKKSKGRLNAHG